MLWLDEYFWESQTETMVSAEKQNHGGVEADTFRTLHLGTQSISETLPLPLNESSSALSLAGWAGVFSPSPQPSRPPPPPLPPPQTTYFPIILGLNLWADWSSYETRILLFKSDSSL